jgi:DnaJ-class molecular chaperone
MTVVFPCENCEGRGYLMLTRQEELTGKRRCPFCNGRGHYTSSDNAPNGVYPDDATPD